METVFGNSIQSGIAIGKIKAYRKADHTVVRLSVADIQKEQDRLAEALRQASEQLQELCDIAVKSANEDSVAIFDAQKMILQDEEYLDSISNIIENESVNAEYAVARTRDKFVDIFVSLDDEYMQARAADVKDVSAMLIGVLSGNDNNELSCTDNKDISGYSEKVIILANELSPSEIIKLDKSMVQSIVTVHGSVISHSAILTRTMNIPSITNVDLENIEQYDGMTAIVDGEKGLIIIEPDTAQIEEYKEQLRIETDRQDLLKGLKGKKTITSSGKEIHLYANVGSLEDIHSAIENDAEGIGLFRSELLCLGTGDFLSEEDQIKIYKQALELMGKKKVVIRTYDIRDDKQMDYLEDREDIFKTQLRALYRAGMSGNLSIMFPMITSLDEVIQIKEIIDDVKSELETQGIPYEKNVELGVMIETPEAVQISNELAKEVDFFSIGTNDLTHYTLGIDRYSVDSQNDYYNHHPEVMSLIKKTIINAHANNIYVGICGELGGNIELTEQFIDMGIDELSVTPNKILKLRERVLKIVCS